MGQKPPTTSGGASSIAPLGLVVQAFIFRHPWQLRLCSPTYPPRAPTNYQPPPPVLALSRAGEGDRGNQ
jgi:hypothetical protein